MLSVRHSVTQISFLFALFYFVFGSILITHSQSLPELRDRITNLYNQSKYEEAIPLAIEYVNQSEQQHTKDNTEYAAAVTLLGRIYFALGEYKKAEPLLQQGLEINERLLGASHKQVAKNLEYLAELYYALVFFDKADELMERAKKIYQN